MRAKFSITVYTFSCIHLVVLITIYYNTWKNNSMHNRHTILCNIFISFPKLAAMLMFWKEELVGKNKNKIKTVNWLSNGYITMYIIVCRISKTKYNFSRRPKSLISDRMYDFVVHPSEYNEATLGRLFWKQTHTHTHTYSLIRKHLYR